MCSRQDLDIILDEVAKSYRKTYGDNITKILLYGSYARGDYHEYSDIDIVAIVKGDRADLQHDLRKVWDVSHDLGLEYEVIVSPTVIPYDEYEEWKEDLPYYRNIENEGIVVNG
ncbi:MAG: nucleotidyltransferase domain-containing protein [Oscillospiraceae bacterium]|nr:nucleotidyltransferase domain-containing protein [Ruminococcus sp.]MCD8345896.1 nucleotidyltransferase domain-containing protein [Oscillospiraceae bacterium]